MRDLTKKSLRTAKQVRAAKARREAKVIKSVRAAVAGRDGPCRLMSIHGNVTGSCGGVPEFAHLGEWRRSKTRGQPPEERHHTKGSLMLCTYHHRMYDAHKFSLGYGPDGADGDLKIEVAC
jgi:hypothetical protein